MAKQPSSKIRATGKPLASVILLWVRTDQPREQGMSYWKDPHSRIISATNGLEEYRQIHLAEENPGQWPKAPGVETDIPVKRKIDGVADVTFKSILGPLLGRKQTQLAYKDEVNVFRRTLLYAGPPYSSRWYNVAEPFTKTGARSLIYLRKRDGIAGRKFQKFINNELVPVLASTGALTELRSEVFMRWRKSLWDTPHVSHDNPVEYHYHASLKLGFFDETSQQSFLNSDEIRKLSDRLSKFTSAIHAYQVSEALTFVQHGKVLPHYLQ